MKCTKCELHKVATQPVPGLGPRESKIMIVGRNPGYEEDREGLPFVGGAGRVLNALLRDAGIRRSECYVTNTVKCLTHKNEPPTDESIRICKEYLRQEIINVHPNVIVALGNEALSVLCGRWGITQWRGSLMLSHFGRTTKVMPTFHPSYIMRGQQRYWTTVVHDLETAGRESLTEELQRAPTEYIIGVPPPEVIEMLMRKDNPISFDIETPGTLKPWQGGILGMSFSWAKGKSVNLAWNVLTEREVAIKVLEGPAPKIVQRGTFDWFYLKYHGVEVANLYFDTKIAAHMTAPILPTDLAYLTSLYTDIPYYKPYSGASVVTMTPKELAEYNNKDADATRRIMFPLKQELQENDQWELFQRQMKLVKTVSKMQLRGVKIDSEAVNSEISAIHQVTQKTEDIFNSRGINVRSGAQVGELLASLGLPLKRTGKTNQYKTDAETLKNLKHPVAERILQFRELDKLRSTFLEAMKGHMVNGRIHTTYNITGTKTGRLSSTDPNLQNIPKRTRHIFIPDGGAFVEADYSQFEIRIIAAIAHEDKLEQDLSDGVNIHLAICQEVYGREEVTEKELFRAKSIVFGTTYGRSPQSIAREYRIPVSEAERIQGLIEHKYPGIYQYKKSMEGKDVLRSPFGRVKYFEGNIKELYNFPIQSTGGDILLGSLVLLDEALPSYASLALTVHDNIVIDCIKGKEMEIAKLVKTTMERPIPELDNRTFNVKCAIGTNWRDLERIDVDATDTTGDGDTNQIPGSSGALR